MSDHVSHVLCC